LIITSAKSKYPCGYFTPTYKLLENTYTQLQNLLKPAISRKHDNQFIELITGGRIDFWTMDNPYAGRSRKYKVAIVDEAAFAKNLWELWTESIRPTLTDLKGSAWFLSTPKGKNDFYKLFVKGQGDNDWASWQMSTYTNPFIEPSEIDAARKDLPDIAFNQEYMAMFNENAANPFGLEHIRKQIQQKADASNVHFYGVDLAKSSDYTCIVGLHQNGSIAYFERFQKDWSSTTAILKMLIGTTPALIDSTGVGDPIVEELVKVCPNAEGFKFTSESKQQIMLELATSVQKREVSILSGVMQEEMESFEYTYSARGVRYSAPDGMHDDTVCALALANHCRLTKQINKVTLFR
jgi:phage FluMu gp28-like protein